MKGLFVQQRHNMMFLQIDSMIFKELIDIFIIILLHIEFHAVVNR